VDLGKGKVVATDGSRLHADDIEANGGPALVVPASAVRLLCKFKGESLITLPCPEGKHAAFSVAGGTLTARLMEGNYPDWEQVMPTRLVTTTFAASEFLTLIEGAKPLAQGVIRLTINGALVISSEAEHGKYEWRIPCIVEKPREGELSYSFNHEYLIDAIRAFPAERVSLGTPETYGACLVNGKAIVMPIRT
jgi:DNA polymerase III sliding clamp (beta) subunit (PCNA family)